MRQFNFIYSKIVKNDKDLAGIIAYSIYKKNKTQYIKSKLKSTGKSELPDSELEEFNLMSNTPIQIENYRNDANKILTEYSNILFQQKLHEIENYYKEKTFTTFLNGVFQNIVASFISTLIIGIIIFTLWSSQIGIQEVIQKVFKITIIQSK